ncbi:MAG: glycosyltransferase family 2 protein [Clostridia bacterium]|nr:glycosyltransferase family 2 protein [Clostridia bacterium]
MISVIVPAFNEEKRIEKTVKAIEEILLKQEDAFEIIVVNDGSRDKTEEVVKTLENTHIRLLSYEKNKGKGGAVKYGVNNAVGDYIIFTDADLPYPPENIEKAKNLLTINDVVLGIRQKSLTGQKYPWYRTVMSKAFIFFVQSVLHLKEKDTQCGFKGFRKEAAQAIFERVYLTGWGFDVETIFVAHKLGLKIGRIEVELFHENKNSKINVIQTTLSMMREVFQVKKNNKKGLYK